MSNSIDRHGAAMLLGHQATHTTHGKGAPEAETRFSPTHRVPTDIADKYLAASKRHPASGAPGSVPNIRVDLDPATHEKLDILCSVMRAGDRPAFAVNVGLELMVMRTEEATGALPSGGWYLRRTLMLADGDGNAIDVTVGASKRDVASPCRCHLSVEAADRGLARRIFDSLTGRAGG